MRSIGDIPGQVLNSLQKTLVKGLYFVKDGFIKQGYLCLTYENESFWATRTDPLRDRIAFFFDKNDFQRAASDLWHEILENLREVVKNETIRTRSQQVSETD